jgi:hypothetical protein
MAQVNELAVGNRTTQTFFGGQPLSFLDNEQRRWFCMHNCELNTSKTPKVRVGSANGLKDMMILTSILRPR